MKSKTINSVICKKFDQFLNSIDDDSVKQLVNKNSIITGGCIASMLLKEPVNDFDLYFRDKETTLAVANYYVTKFKDLAKQKHADGKEILIHVVDENDRVKIHIKSEGIASDKGTDNYQYFESRPPEEGEDYISSVTDAVEKLDEMSIVQPSSTEFRPVFMSANAITLSDQFQIVVRFYGDPDNIHQHYDYIHCTNYWTSDTRKVVLKPEALEALLAKELVYVGSKYPICSIIRTRKFLKRGYTINAGQYLKMAYQISQLDLNNLEVLEDQLIGVDAAYFGQLIDALKEHKTKKDEKQETFTLDYGYLATIIDKIF